MYVHNIEYRIVFGIHVKGHSIVLHRNSLISHIEMFIRYPTIYSDFIMVLAPDFRFLEGGIDVEFIASSKCCLLLWHCS